LIHAGHAYAMDQLADREDKARYIGYLKYANNQYLQLVDRILKDSKQPPVIIFISDHGFRQPADSPFKDQSFYNFCSVYLPDKNYQAFYPGISNVNLLRVILNQEFRQQLPLLKDSTIFLHD
jgi:hypothetical protein